MAWDFPKSIFEKQLTVVTTVRLWNNEQKVFMSPVERKRDVTSFFFPDATFDSNVRILTYRVQVFSAKGEEVDVWEHHFWTELIDIDKTSSAQRMSDSVSSQPRQGSVIETP